jgi:ABC-type nitrate/sulfonate/bicarbonate transport system substrate-binding protein
MKRRQFLKAATGGAIGLIATPYILPAQAQTKAIRISRLPWGAINSCTTALMIKDKLVEKAAEELGFKATVEWRDYPAAQPSVEGMRADALDIGLWGNTPVIRSVALGMPVSMLLLGEGRLNFQICVRPNSPIKNLNDLRGKRVGTLLGGDPHFFLSMVLGAYFGDPNPAAHNITMVQVPSFAQAATMPEGLDAVSLITPAYLKGVADGRLVKLVDNYGMTGAAYEGPEGKGADIQLPQFKKSQFYPESFYLHRTIWMTRSRFAQEEPKSVEAFLLAHERALGKVAGMKPEEAAALAFDFWKIDPKEGAVIVKDDLLYRRGWGWLTEGDLRGLTVNSKTMVEAKILPSPIDMAIVKKNVASVQAIAKSAYDRLKAPAAAEFLRTDQDIRGKPFWEI